MSAAKFDDIMVDLETLGSRAGCQIISIGAARFSRSSEVAIGETFYTLCSLHKDNQAELGLSTDESTLTWWKGQSAEARTALTEAKRKNAPHLTNALAEFARFVGWTDSKGLGDARVWGNGSDFDCAILYAAYAAVGEPVPWKFWNTRCFRTLKSEFPGVPKPERKGTHHNALDDAIYQAEHAAVIFRSLAAAQPRRGV